MEYSIENIDQIVIFGIKNKDINSNISADLKEQLLILSQPDIKALVVDISEVQTIDSAGIGSFLLAERQLSDHGVPMAFVGANGVIKSTMRMLNLDQLFDFFETKDEAKKTILDILK
jgi:anti-anti-sigma factor